MRPEGWEVLALFLLPGGHDIPAGGFDHHGNMEIVSGKIKIVKMHKQMDNLTTFSTVAVGD